MTTLPDGLPVNPFTSADWFVDGYRIPALGEVHATEMAKLLYNLDAVEVHPWADGDVETGDASTAGAYLDGLDDDAEAPSENAMAAYFALSALLDGRNS